MCVCVCVCVCVCECESDEEGMVAGIPSESSERQSLFADIPILLPIRPKTWVYVTAVTGVMSKVIVMSISLGAHGSENCAD